MALYQKDRAQLSAGADALASLILGNKHKAQHALKQQEFDQANAEQKAALEQAAVDANVARATQFAEAQGLQPGKFSIQASQSGYGVNPEPAKDPLAALLAGERLAMQREKEDDKAVQVLSKRVEQADLAPAQAALEGLGQSVKEKGIAFGGISANIPAWATAIGEKVGLAKQGAAEQVQHIEQLKSFQRSKLYGASLTPGEKASFEKAFGIMATGTPEERKRALITMQNIYNKAVQNVAAGSPERIRQKYADQGGINLSPVNAFGDSAPPGGMDPAKKKRLAELRAKLKGGPR